MSEYGAQCITAALELILPALCMLVTVQQSLKASKEACTRAPASATFQVGLEATVRTMPHREERLIPPLGSKRALLIHQNQFPLSLFESHPLAL